MNQGGTPCTFTSKLHILGLLTLLSCPALAEWPAKADRSMENAVCGERSLTGRWAFRAQGTGPFGAFIAIGVQTFNAAGSLEVREFVAVGGSTMESRMTGTYELSPDCTGTMTTVFENGMAGTLAFVYAGDRMYALETDPACRSSSSSRGSRGSRPRASETDWHEPIRDRPVRGRRMSQVDLG